MQHIINDEEYNELVRLRKEEEIYHKQIKELKNCEAQLKINKNIFIKLNMCWDKCMKGFGRTSVIVDKNRLEDFFKYYLLIDGEATFDWVER
jgi:hypothetical protein